MYFGLHFISSLSRIILEPTLPSIHVKFSNLKLHSGGNKHCKHHFFFFFSQTKHQKKIFLNMILQRMYIWKNQRYFISFWTKNVPNHKELKPN